jgi:hypothetical protein
MPHLKMLIKVVGTLLFLTSASILLCTSTCHAGHANAEGDAVFFWEEDQQFRIIFDFIKIVKTLSERNNDQILLAVVVCYNSVSFRVHAF